jgi:cytoskeletal protein RodZ
MIGEALKRAREERGLSLHDVAAMTKISAVALEALERRDYSRLPGGIFGRAFIRGYASAVGLDAEAAVAEFLEDRAQQEREAAKIVRRPQVTADDQQFLDRQQRAVRQLRIALAIAAAIAVGVLAYEIWLWWPRPEPVTVTTPPLYQAPSPPAAEKPPAPAPAPAKIEPTAPPMVFEFTATADCWLELNADGVIVLNRQLKAGESRRVEATRELRLHAGNPGALDWKINGRAGRVLGEAGISTRAMITRQNVKTFFRQDFSPLLVG